MDNTVGDKTDQAPAVQSGNNTMSELQELVQGFSKRLLELNVQDFSNQLSALNLKAQSDLSRREAQVKEREDAIAAKERAMKSKEMKLTVADAEARQVAFDEAEGKSREAEEGLKGRQEEYAQRQQALTDEKGRIRSGEESLVKNEQDLRGKVMVLKKGKDESKAQIDVLSQDAQWLAAYEDELAEGRALLRALADSAVREEDQIETIQRLKHEHDDARRELETGRNKVPPRQQSMDLSRIQAKIAEVQALIRWVADTTGELFMSLQLLTKQRELVEGQVNEVEDLVY